MNLHTNKELFTNALKAAATHFGIRDQFIEKDYWISYILYNLSKSEFAESVVFKGGTSLSKAHSLIDRFSEDVDIAVIGDSNNSPNKIKSIIREIEKKITDGLTEIELEGVTSKGSKYRKTVFQYPDIAEANDNNQSVTIEINAFINPISFDQFQISSLIFQFLAYHGNTFEIGHYNLEPFSLNVLSKEQTLLEKIASLIRNSFDENFQLALQSKIRHFYDLYYLMQDESCRKFVDDIDFKTDLLALINHDRAIFDDPTGWQQREVSDSPLIKDFENTWKLLQRRYESELKSLSYGEIPSSDLVFEMFTQLIIPKLN